MSFSLAVVLILLQTRIIVGQFYGSLGGYACSQQSIYVSCQCPTFCSAYDNAHAGYRSFPHYKTWSRRHHHKRRHHKKKFQVSEPDSEELPLQESSTSAPRSSTHSWENEDLWEKKFVNSKSKTKTSESGTEELPEIDSAEIAAARARMRGHVEKAESLQAPATLPNTGARLPIGDGVGIGSGLGVGPIGVSSGLGIGAPGIGGLGGQGGIFGISSGVGVGVPGVGPIGISSGLGIGR